MSLIDFNETPASTLAGAPPFAPHLGDHRIEGLGLRVWTRAETLSACAALGLFALFAASLWGLKGAVVPWDAKNHFYPMFRFLADALHRGEAPLWNPYLFGGHPTAADPQSLLFTPTVALFALLAPHASMTAFDLMIFAHLAAGAFAIVGLCRRRGWAPAAAVLVALVYMLGGSASARLQHTGMIISYAWFPFAFWSLEVMLARNSWRMGALFGLCAGLMAVGRDQVAYLFCLFLIANVLWHGGRNGRPISYLKQRWAPLLIAAVVGAAILIVPALLTMQFLSGSNRPSIGYATAVAGSLNPVNLVTLLAPDFFGSIDWNFDYYGPGSHLMAGADRDDTDRCIDYLFVGSLPVLLLFWHGLGGGRLFMRGARFFLCAFVFALLYAVGRYTPVFAVVYDHVPGVKLYRRPADATFLLNVALAFLSGHLLNKYISDGLPRPFQRLPRLIGHALPHLGALGVVTLLIVGLHFAWLQGRFSDALLAAGLSALWYGVCAVALTTMRAPHVRRMAAAILVAATGAQLIWRNAASSLNAEAADHYSVLQSPSPSEQAGLDFLSREVIARRSAGGRPRVEILGLGGPWQNASMIYGFENSLGYNPLRISEYEQLVGPAENAADLTLRRFPDSFRSYGGKLANLLGLEYLVLPEPLARLPKRFPRPSATLVFSTDNLFVYRLGHASPRAYLAHAVMAAETDGVVKAGAFPDFDSAQDALLDAHSMSLISGDVAKVAARSPAAPMAPALPPEQVSVVAYNDNDVTLAVEANRPGVVVLHDLFYPGWQVTVDGERRPLLRANILFRGVETPAGKHVVKFAYQPFSLENLEASLRSARKEAD